ncbi:hypothetical protein JCM3774_000527 [Rhodotorula dairenensis]
MSRLPLGDSSNRIRPRTPEARANSKGPPADKVVSRPNRRVEAGKKSQLAALQNPDDSRTAAVAVEQRVARSTWPIRQPDTASVGPTTEQVAEPTSAGTAPRPTTPPRLSLQPPRVVETCPTPPSAARTCSGPPSRRRSVVATEPDAEESDVEPVVRSLVPSKSRSRSRSREGLDATAPRPDASAESDADSVEGGAFDSLPATNREGTLSRRQRPRSPRPRTDAQGGSDAAAPPWYDPGSAELVTALLSPRRRVSSASQHSTTACERSVRIAHDSSASRPELLSFSALGPPFGSSSIPASLAPSPPTNRYRPSLPSPASHPLRPQASMTTLLSWDLAHLPAPQTPRERPYRVSWKSVLLPTSCLGGGKGSGLYGDQWGAVERKVSRTDRPSFAAAAAATAGSPSAQARSPRGVDSGAPAPSPFSGSSRTPDSHRRGGSLLRRLRRASGFSEMASSTAEPRTSRRRSLVTSIFGGGGGGGGSAKSSTTSSPAARSIIEELNQWVPVVVR